MGRCMSHYDNLPLLYKRGVTRLRDVTCRIISSYPENRGKLRQGAAVCRGLSLYGGIVRDRTSGIDGGAASLLRIFEANYDEASSVELGAGEGILFVGDGVEGVGVGFDGLVEYEGIVE